MLILIVLFSGIILVGGTLFIAAALDSMMDPGPQDEDLELELSDADLFDVDEELTIEFVVEDPDATQVVEVTK